MAPPGPALAAGLLFFPGLFVLARAALRRRCSEAHAVILAARLVSSVQAVMASTAGFIIASSCQHVMDDQHWLAGAYPPFAVPYFLYDVYAMFLCHRHRARVKGHEAAPAPPFRASAVAFLRREPLLVLHHVTMVLGCFPAACLWRQGKGDFFLGCLLLAELSTPCVCLGKVLVLLGLQHTALHRLNGLLLLVTFLLCRVLLFPFLYYAYGRHRGLPLLRVPAALPPGANAAAAALLAPQLYWFALICRRAWRLRGGPVGKPMGSPIETPIGGAAENPIGKPIGSPIGKPIETPIGGAIETPIGSPIETPIGGAIETPIGSPIETPIGSPIETPIGGATETPIGSPIENPIGKPIETPIGGAIETPIGSPIETPIGGATETPIGSPIENPIGKPIETPIGGAIETPIGSPIETPIGSPIETPIGGATETPIGNPIETPIGSPIGNPIESPIGKPIGSPIGKPIETPIGGATETPIGSPIENPIETPIESPAPRPIVGPIQNPTPRPMDSPIAGPIGSPTENPGPQRHPP